jgi:hypothetical protein
MSGVSETVNNWFHNNDECGTSPACYIQHVSDCFLKQVKGSDLYLVCADKVFRTLMCEALCVLYHAEITNRKLKGPIRKMQKPLNWNEEAETCWIDYLHSRIFSNTFWEAVWHDLPTADWEESIPNWRHTIQLIMPDYVKREVAVLSEANLMFVDADGEIIDALDYDLQTPEMDDY